MTILPNKMSRELWDSIQVGDILVQTRSNGQDLTGQYYVFTVANVDRYWRNVNGKQWQATFELTSTKGETLRHNDSIMDEIHLVNTGEK